MNTIVLKIIRDSLPNITLAINTEKQYDDLVKYDKLSTDFVKFLHEKYTYLSYSDISNAYIELFVKTENIIKY